MRSKRGISNIRRKCPNKDVCGSTGHIFKEGVWQRCQCLKMEMNQKDLGLFFSEHPKHDPQFSELLYEDVLLEDSMSKVKPYIAGTLLDRPSDMSFLSIDAYRLIEIFLEKDPDYTTIGQVTEKDLLILLLGFGDPRNSYLPELILQVLTRRQLLQLPTWVVLGISANQIPGKYSEDVHHHIQEFRKVRVAQ